MHTAERKNTEKMQYDLKSMHILLGMLKYNPNLDARSIRPILAECVRTHFMFILSLLTTFGSGQPRIIHYHKMKILISQ